MYSNESSAADNKRGRPKALKKDRTPDSSNRGPYLSLIESNTLPNLSTGMDSMQTESGLLVIDQLQMPSVSNDLLLNGSIGIDKVRMSVPIFLGNTSIEMIMARLLGKSENDNEGKVVIPDFPHVYIRWDNYRQKLIITFNPSEFTWVQGLQICPFILFKPIVKLCVTELLRYGDPEAIPKFLFDEDTGEVFNDWPEDWGTHCQVFNLHVAQDFVITDPRFNLGQLEGCQPKKTKGAVSIRNRLKLNTLTHISGKKAARLSLYNKSNERIANPRPEAPALADFTYRFEAQVPRRILKKQPVHTIDGCIEENLIGLQSRLWEDSKLGKDLIWEGSLIQELLLNFPVNRAHELYGYAISRQYGIESNYSEKEVRELERDLNAAKIDLRIPLNHQGKPYGRLDPQIGGLSTPSPRKTRRMKGNPLDV